MPPETVLLFYAVFAALSVAAVFKGVEWGLYMYVGMYFLVPWQRWWGGWLPEWQWMQIIAILCIAAFAIQYGRYRRTRVFDSPVMVALLLYTVMLLVFIPFAVWPERHLFVVDKHLKMLVVLVIMYKVIDTPLKFERLLWVYMLGMFYLGSVVRDRGRTSGGRMDGIGTIDSVDVNDLTAALVLGTPLLLFYALEGKRLWIRGLALLALAYVLNAIILGGSRGGFLGLIAAAGAYLFYSTIVIKRSAAYRAKVAAGVAGAVALFVYLADATFWQRMATLFGADSVREADDGGRTRIWGYAWRLATENPFGLGAHGFTSKSPDILPPELLTDGAGSIRSVHSMYFEALTAYGFLGLGLVLAMLWLAFRTVRRTQESLRRDGDQYNLLLGSALLSGFVGYLICAVFITRNYHEATYYALVFMAIFAAVHRQRRGEAPVDAAAPLRPAPMTRREPSVAGVSPRSAARPPRTAPLQSARSIESSAGIPRGTGNVGTGRADS